MTRYCSTASRYLASRSSLSFALPALAPAAAQPGSPASRSVARRLRPRVPTSLALEHPRRSTSVAQPVDRWLYPWALAYAAIGTALGGVLAVTVGYRATFPAVSCVVALEAPTSLLAWRRPRSSA